MFFFDDYKSRKTLLRYLNFAYKLYILSGFKRRKNELKDYLCKLHGAR